MLTWDIDWSPTLFLGHEKLSQDKIQKVQEKHNRYRALKRKREEAASLEGSRDEETEMETVPLQQPDQEKSCSTDVETQTDHTGELPNDFFDQEYFTNDDDKIRYYTGLPNKDILESVFGLVVPFPGTKQEYYWRSFIVTLMRLRLATGYQDLSYRLGVSLSTLARRFQEMLDMMAVRLDFLIFWPDREELRKTMPLCFRATYGTKVVAIMDCYEVKIEKPSNLLAKGSTWSQYKHANTVKVLIAVAPQGATTFVSECWGGRVSDKHLTNQCGILNKLLPGDILLADRGFDITEEVAMMQASLQIPAFTRGMDQLPPTEIEKTRKLANLRIHVERVIGATRQRFSILSSVLPIQYMTARSRDDIPNVDKIVRVCSALNNVCVSVVPFE